MTVPRPTTNSNGMPGADASNLEDTELLASAPCICILLGSPYLRPRCDAIVPLDSHPAYATLTVAPF